MAYSIVFLDRDSLSVPIPALTFAHCWRDYSVTKIDEIVPRCVDSDIVVTNKVPLPGAVLRQLPQLAFVAVAATGVDHIDLASCRSLGIAVANVRHYADEAVAEHTFMLMLALMKNLPAYQRDVAAGAWENASQFCYLGAPLRDLDGAVLGIIGNGGIGQAVAARARAFGMTVLFGERKQVGEVREGYTAFDELLRVSDVISLHCPLTEETRGLITAPELRRMKPGAILINTARGGLVNEVDVAAALQCGQLAGVALDVLSEEPPARGNGLLAAHFPQLIITPHIAWASHNSLVCLATQLIANIESFVRGVSVNRVV